MHQTVSIIW